ncbi:hypothetical protein HRS9139_04538 [Pyrenophora teres f. teres]|nr:hypothetical protein HRS9139_04538 [Pyrenophora teres f. teres]
MSHQQNMSPSASLSLTTASHQLPYELLVLVLHYYIGAPEFFVDASQAPLYRLSYKNDSSPHLSSLPSGLVPEYHKARLLDYKRNVKTFISGYDFCMTHLLLSLHPASGVPAFTIPYYSPWATITGTANLRICLGEGISPPTTTILLPNPARLPPHPLSTIRLDLSAPDYFTLFAVSLPPLPPLSAQHPAPHDDQLLPAVADVFLAHTNHLILHFGTRFKAANPWYDTADPAWCEPLGVYDYSEARCRPHVCDSGAIVDWILEFAWKGGLLQHIPCITLEGDVQAWVKEKWEGIFERQRGFLNEQAKKDGEGEVNPFAIHYPDIPAIMTRGVGIYDKDAAQEGEKMEEEEKEQIDPRHLFPPPCKCKVGCWRLGGGKVLDESVSEILSWGQFEEAKDEAQGGWMDNFELGLHV